MEWRIIFAVLCLIGILSVPGNAQSSVNNTAINATDPNATAPNATAPNATAPNATAPNATAPNATAPNATAPNATAPNATAPNATAPNATAPNATAPNATAPNATAPNATAPNATAPNATAPNATAPNATAPNATAPNATAPNATAPNATAPNATAPNATAPNATAPNATAPNGTSTNGTASANSTTPLEFNLSFSIADTFKSTYSDMSNPETLSLVTKITSQFEPVYKKRFPKFLKMVIKQFRSGSILTDSALQFDSNSTLPNVTDVKQTIADAIANGNVTLNISTTSINVTAPAAPNVTASNTTLNGTSINGTASANSTTQYTEFSISFSINDTFKDVYSNLSAPETLSLITNITSQIEPVYKKRFSNFLRMVVKQFRSGSILTDAVLQFDSNSTLPNVTDVKQVLIDAISNGNVTFSISNTTINVTAPVTPVTPSNTISTTPFNVTFSIVDTFNDTLSNLSSSDAITLQTKIISQFGSVFNKRFTNFLRMLIRKFSKGSIVTDGSLEFNSTGSNVTVAAKDVVDTIIQGIKNGNFTFTIDQKSIKVTDSSGNTASNSAVITSMLTVLWMTLASLLLSGVMYL